MSNTILVASLCPNSFSRASRRAAMLATGLNCRNIDYLAVMKPDEKGENIRTLCHHVDDVKAASASASILFGMCCSARFEVGSLSEAACKRAGGLSPALIALAWQCHPWWPVLHNFGLLRDLSRRTGKPVLLVRQAPTQPYSHAVYPCDFSLASIAALALAIRLMPYVRITVLHAFTLPGEGQMRSVGVRNSAIEHCRERLEREARDAYARVLDTLKPHAARLSLALLPKQPEKACEHYVNDVGADLIILSDSRRWLVDEWCWQSGMRDLVGGTSSDVLMIGATRAGRRNARSDTFSNDHGRGK